MNSLHPLRPSHIPAPPCDSNRTGLLSGRRAGRRTPALRPRRPQPTTSATHLFCSNSWYTGPESLLLASPVAGSYGCDLDHVPEIRNAKMLVMKLSDPLNFMLAENLPVSCCFRAGFCRSTNLSIGTVPAGPFSQGRYSGLTGRRRLSAHQCESAVLEGATSKVASWLASELPPIQTV